MRDMVFIYGPQTRYQWVQPPQLPKEAPMDSPVPPLFAESSRSHWVRLRTLIMLRWVGILGQLAALEGARRLVGVDLNMAACLSVVGVAVLANVIAILIFPENRRLSEHETLATLMFDTGQLALLLYLTGGLHNPFALLILAPVTISAAALRLGSTLLLAGWTVGLVVMLGFYFVPLRTLAGEVLALPDLFRIGFGVAIINGVLFLALYARRVSTEIASMSDALLATQMALAREQKLTDLGGVVAAAAHELGTPLATIKLVSSELIEELEDRPALQEDAVLIRDQANRCRDILRSMGRAGKDDLHMHMAPLDSVIREAAEPHLQRGKQIHFTVAPEKGGQARQPSIHRRPEIIHGLRNLVQNGVDFASGHVWIDARWTETTITIRIADDGAGFPPQALGRIGDPFIRLRRAASDRDLRPEYEGMGLGLFIAKTLLERSGAALEFSNGRQRRSRPGDPPARCGACIEVAWPRNRIALDEMEKHPLGENTPIPIR